MRKDFKDMDLTDDDGVQEGYTADNKTLKKFIKLKKGFEHKTFEDSYLPRKREEDE